MNLYLQDNVVGMRIKGARFLLADFQGKINFN